MRYTVYLDDPSATGGFSAVVVSDQDFAAIRDADDQFARVTSLDDGAEIWLNRHRIIRAVAAR